jgi:hypothetical protein
MSYKKWISVNLEHGYFADNRCPSLRFEPTNDCEEQMRRGGQFFYAMPNRFLILLDTDKIKKDQNSAGENCFIDIAMYSRDPLFGSYSNLEIDYRQGRVYYIGNTLKSSTDETEEKSLILTDRQEDKKHQAVPVLLKPKQFVISIDNAAPGDTLKLLDKNNAVVEETQVKDKTAGTSLFVDVSRKRAGIYSLETNNRVTAYVYADDMLFNTKPALIIGIEAPCPGGGDIDNPVVLEYDIHAAGRAVSWEYRVIARGNGRKLKNLEIKSSNEKSLPGVSFEQVRIDEERKEAVFVSNKPIPLSERPYQSIELIEKGNSGTPLIPHLPNADISSLHIKEGKWMSQIYVYI